MTGCTAVSAATRGSSAVSVISASRCSTIGSSAVRPEEPPLRSSVQAVLESDVYSLWEVWQVGR